MAVLSFSPSRGTTLYKAYRTPVVVSWQAAGHVQRLGPSTTKVRLLFKEVDFMSLSSRFLQMQAKAIGLKHVETK